jgi:hypothetical protein
VPNAAHGAHVTGSPGRAGDRAGQEITPAGPKAPPEAPSWSRVLATTLSLWASRRLPGPRPRALLLIICVLAVGAAAVGVVELTSTSAPAARVSSPARPHQVRPSRSAGAARSAAVAASVRSQAAAWITGQVSSADTIGCDPLMCAALVADGVAASRLLPLGPAASGASGADVIAASALSRTGLSREAPALLASFGSGGSLIEVRAASPGGPAGYQVALAADVAARRSAGAQLLHSRRIEVGAPGTGQIQAGQVDSRLLITLALLASQRSWRVIAFGDASPGVPLTEAPFRQVIITGAGAAGGAGGAGGLAAAVALLDAQRAPYQAARVAAVQLAGGQAGLRIDFAAPSPLGLLTSGAHE